MARGARLCGGGKAIRDDRGGRPKVVRLGRRSWSEEKEAKFLDTLAATCSVTIALEEAAVSRSALYRQRRSNPGFAARWREALDIGYERLEARLIESAERALSGEAPDEDSPFPDMTVAQAIVVLQQHHVARKAVHTRTAWRCRDKPIEDVRASLARKLDAIERARDHS
jgi:hypothetical protein